MIKRAGRTRLIGALTLAATLAVAAIAAGKFGTNGRVVTDLGGVNSADAVAVARDGRIVAAGHTTVDGTFDFAVVRYRKGGAIDDSFGTGGARIDNLGGFESTAAALALPNRKILLAGNSDGGLADSQGTLVRYRQGGGLDSSFGGDGVTQYVVVGGSTFSDVARQPDGKYVAVGEQAGQMLIVRFRAGGGLDSSFGNGTGAKLVQINDVTRASAVAVQPNGRIVIAGETQPGGMTPTRHAAFVRLRPNGSFDNSFSKDGRRTVKLPLDFGGIGDAAVRRNKVYAAGFAGTISGRHALLIRLGKKGGLDKSFAGNGRKLHKYGANVFLDAIAFQGRKLVAVGQRDDPIADFFVARFKGSGGKDRSFSKDGWNTTDVDGGDVAQGVAVQRDRRIVLAGTSGGTDGFILVRYRKNGALDK
jgi:uncharacterized delta-60 repeat protein